MRRSWGVLALLRSVLLGLVLVAAAQPGASHAQDLGKRWAAAARPGASHAQDLGKRWAAAAPTGNARVPAPLLGKRRG